MRAAVILFGLLALASWLLFFGPDDPPIPTGADDTPVPSESAMGMSAEGEALRRQLLEPEGAASIVASNPAPEGRPAGRLRVTVLDAADGTAIEAVSYRIASETRLARVRNRNPLDVRVSTGEYHLGVHADGYDSLLLGPAQVEEEAVTDLGNVLMSLGAGAIEGRVLAGGKPVPGCEVELHGRGRARCPACPRRADAEKEPPPCTSCSRAASHSSTTVADDGRFRFERLAGGEYHVLARRDDVVERAVGVKLEPRGYAQVDLELTDRFTLNVQVVGAEQKPFDGWWVEKETTYHTVIRLHFAVAGIHVGDAVVDPLVPASAAENPLAAAPTEAPDPSRLVGAVRREPPDIADLPRRDRSGQALWPRPFPPEVRLAPLRGERLAAGLYRVENLPTGVDEVIVSCGPFFTSSEAFEATPGAEITVVMPPLRKCGAPTSMLAGAITSTPDRPAQTTCASCHALPRTLGFSK